MIREGESFRPWGNFHSVFRNHDVGDWNFLGCVSMEDRCSATSQELPQHLNWAHKLVLRIDDNPSLASDEINRKTDLNEQIFLANGFDVNDFSRLGISTAFGVLDERLKEFLGGLVEPNIVLDITSLPKKVFFFIIRLLLSGNYNFENIVITYAKPERYASAPLSESPEPWDALPGFRLSRDKPKHRKLIIGVGFEPLGLTKISDTGEFRSAPVSFLFPFPSKANRIAKNWRFIRRIFPNESHIDVISVDASNLPEVYDKICGMGDGGDLPIALAPYGPKPMSLAMAIYASNTGATENPTGVYYTQPTFYNPDYSGGIKRLNGIADIDAYCLTLNGNKLYS